MKKQLTTIQSKMKLLDYLAIVSENKRLKDESQKRKSVDVLPPNTTITLMSAKARKPSPELASCPPWSQDTRPRYHEDPVTAITSLNATLGNPES